MELCNQVIDNGVMQGPGFQIAPMNNNICSMYMLINIYIIEINMIIFIPIYLNAKQFLSLFNRKLFYSMRKEVGVTFDYLLIRPYNYASIRLVIMMCRAGDFNAV